MSWAAVIAGGTAIAGSVIGSQGAQDAAKNQRRAATAALRTQQQQYAQTRADLAPWMSAGTAALNEQRRQLGLPPMTEAEKPFVPSLETLKPLPSEYYGNKKKAKKGGQYYDPRTGQVYKMTSEGPGAGQFGATSTVIQALKSPETNVSAGGSSTFNEAAGGSTLPAGGRYGAFETTPGYLFKYDETMKAVNSQNAARGRSYSGAALREAARYAAGLASQEYDNYYNRLAGLSNTGANTSVNAASIGTQQAGNMGTAQLASGMARSSGIANQADIWGQTAGVLGDIASEYFRNRKKPPISGGPYGSYPPSP